MVAKSARGGAAMADRGGHSRSTEPKPESGDAATIAAIKVALDEGRYERAAALLDVLRGPEAHRRIVPLCNVGR